MSAPNLYVLRDADEQLRRSNEAMRRSLRRRAVGSVARWALARAVLGAAVVALGIPWPFVSIVWGCLTVGHCLREMDGLP